MSHEQLKKPQPSHEEEAIKYGDVFDIGGELATKAEEAPMMQVAEAAMLGQTQKGGPAAVMQSAATKNVRAGVVGDYNISDLAAEQGVSVLETVVPGGRIITESVADQVVGQYVEPTPTPQTATKTLLQSAITIGEALEATARTCGNKPVDHSDAAAIQAAEARATGSTVIVPGGLSAAAQSAASCNDTMQNDQHKIKLCDVLSGATTRMVADKVATHGDAEGVTSAELRNNPELKTYPGGVADSIACAARLNENVASV